MMEAEPIRGVVVRGVAYTHSLCGLALGEGIGD